MSLGKSLVAIGAVLVAAGLALQFAPALRLGRLPGDVSFGGSGWRVYAPLGTSLVLSAALWLALALISGFARR